MKRIIGVLATVNLALGLAVFAGGSPSPAVASGPDCGVNYDCCCKTHLDGSFCCIDCEECNSLPEKQCTSEEDCP